MSTRSQTAASSARLQRRLAKIPLQVRAAAAAQALISANNLAIAMKGAAPKDDGTLAASVRVEQGARGDRFFVKAGGPTTTRPVREGATAQYDYAMAGEYGTAKEPARAWFTPTYRARKAKIKKDIETAALAAAKQLSD